MNLARCIPDNGEEALAPILDVIFNIMSKTHRIDLGLCIRDRSHVNTAALDVLKGSDPPLDRVAVI